MDAIAQLKSPSGAASLASLWFDSTLPPGDAWIVSEAAWEAQDRLETDVAAWHWLREMLRELGYLPESLALCEDDTPVAGVLHVGFVSISETPEMLSRVARKESDEPSRPARSRVMAELQRIDISPIDGTAARVSPGDST